MDLQGVWPLQHLPLFHSDLQEVDSLLLLVLLLLLLLLVDLQEVDS